MYALVIKCEHLVKGHLSAKQTSSRLLFKGSVWLLEGFKRDTGQ